MLSVGINSSQDYMLITKEGTQAMAYPNKEYSADFDGIKMMSISADHADEMQYIPDIKAVTLHPSKTSDKRIYKINASIQPGENIVINEYALTLYITVLYLATGERKWISTLRNRTAWYFKYRLDPKYRNYGKMGRYEAYDSFSMSALFECTLTGDDSPIALTTSMVVRQSGDKPKHFMHQHVDYISFLVTEVYRSGTI